MVKRRAIDHILEKRVRNGNVEYKLKFKGSPKKGSNFFPARFVDSAPNSRWLLEQLELREKKEKSKRMMTKKKKAGAKKWKKEEGDDVEESDYEYEEKEEETKEEDWQPRALKVLKKRVTINNVVEYLIKRDYRGGVEIWQTEEKAADCQNLINRYNREEKRRRASEEAERKEEDEKRRKKRTQPARGREEHEGSDDDNVEAILDKRVNNGQVQYLFKMHNQVEPVWKFKKLGPSRVIDAFEEERQQKELAKQRQKERDEEKKRKKRKGAARKRDDQPSASAAVNDRDESVTILGRFGRRCYTVEYICAIMVLSEQEVHENFPQATSRYYARRSRTPSI